MEIVRISEEKLKLTLCKEDLEKYSIKIDELDYDKTETRRVIWQILDDAKKRTGFDAASDKALIEAYPGRRGGCEIYVTLLCDKKRKKGVRGRLGVYRFGSVEALFALCTELCKEKRLYESDLYCLPRDKSYYLVLKEPIEESIRKENTLSPLSFIEEYGERCKESELLPYIKEHGTCLIAKSAAKRLSVYGTAE